MESNHGSDQAVSRAMLTRLPRGASCQKIRPRRDIPEVVPLRAAYRSQEHHSTFFARSSAFSHGQGPKLNLTIDTEKAASPSVSSPCKARHPG